MVRKTGEKETPRKEKTMNMKTTYEADDIAKDLGSSLEEIAAATEMTLDETLPENFSSEKWTAMREAIKRARETLDELEEMIDRRECEAEDYDPELDENRYETWWA